MQSLHFAGKIAKIMYQLLPQYIYFAELKIKWKNKHS